MNFQSLGLQPSLLKSLEQMQFITPTPIQLQAIPPALEGKDVLGNAQTGTGKTGAFGIPLVNWLLNSAEGTALILAPTRELAMQVLDALQKMIGRDTGIRTALLIGGDPISEQFKRLRNMPRLIVATPGRLNDHIERNTVKLDKTGFLVLDEIDRMLDMGFDVQLEKIIKCLPKQRQTLMFSATLPQNIIKLSQKYLSDPVRISVGSAHAPLVKIKQEVVQVTESNKYDQLISQLNEREGSIIIFVKTKMGAEKLAEKLCRQNHDADAIHGDLRQNKRERVINAFRKRKYRIMVATDVAARGLDIPHIEHVINYDMPQCPEDYIHRIGRTARAGAEGAALSFVTQADGAKWRAIDRLLNHGESTDRNQRSGGQSSSRGNRSGDSSRFKRNASGRDGGSRNEERDGGSRGGGSRGGAREWTPREGSRDGAREWTPRSAGARDGTREWTPRGAAGAARDGAPRSAGSSRDGARGGEWTPRAAGPRDGAREWTPRAAGPRDGAREWTPRAAGPRDGAREWTPRAAGPRDGAREWTPRAAGPRDGTREWTPRAAGPRDGAREWTPRSGNTGPRGGAPRGGGASRGAAAPARGGAPARKNNSSGRQAFRGDN